jgi:hypothetical protein
MQFSWQLHDVRLQSFDTWCCVIYCQCFKKSTASAFGIDRSKSLPWTVRKHVNPKDYTGCGKTPCPNFVRWWADQNKDLLSRNYILEMCPCSATDHQIGPENQAKPLKYSKKCCILHQFRADVQTYKHQPWYTADNDTAQTDVWLRSAISTKWLQTILSPAQPFSTTTVTAYSIGWKTLANDACLFGWLLSIHRVLLNGWIIPTTCWEGTSFCACQPWKTDACSCPTTPE